jgi:hypothetical protein
MRKEHHIKIRSIDSRIPKVMETPRPAYHSHRASEEDVNFIFFNLVRLQQPRA